MTMNSDIYFCSALQDDLTVYNTTSMYRDTVRDNLPPNFHNWCLVSLPGAITDPHHDVVGSYTDVEAIIGAKVWIIGTPQDPMMFSTNNEKGNDRFTTVSDMT